MRLAATISCEITRAHSLFHVKRITPSGVYWKAFGFALKAVSLRCLNFKIKFRFNKFGCELCDVFVRVLLRSPLELRRALCVQCS